MEERFYQIFIPKGRLVDKIMKHNGLLTETLWSEIFKNLNAKYPNIYDKIDCHHAALSDIQIIMLYLLCLNAPNYIIASLLNMSQQNLYGYKKKNISKNDRRKADQTPRHQ